MLIVKSIVTSSTARCCMITTDKKISVSLEEGDTPFLREVWARARCGRMGGILKGGAAKKRTE